MKIFYTFLCLVPFLASAGEDDFYPNFHTVEKGRLYRSAQLSGSYLRKKIRKLKLKTVINLRGAAPEEDWYRDEKRVTREEGILLIDIGMGSSRLPHREDLLRLIDVFEKAPRPILIHCYMGADRTGEAAAIYAMDFMGKTLEEASELLSYWYGHFSFLYPAKDYFIQELYRGREWARKMYQPCRENYKYYDRSQYCR